MKNFRKYFLTGVITILPLLITYWFLRWLFLKVDAFLFQPFLFFLKDYVQFPGIEFVARVVILILFLFVVAFLGFLVSFLFFKKIFSKLEQLIFKLPFVGKVYNSIKQISIAIVGQGKNIFKKVVLIEYPTEGRFCIGFITAEAEEMFNKASGKKLVAVFIPTTPNPTSGILIYYPKTLIKVLDISVEEGMRIVISAGSAVIASDDRKK